MKGSSSASQDPSPRPRGCRGWEGCLQERRPAGDAGFVSPEERNRAVFAPDLAQPRGTGCREFPPAFLVALELLRTSAFATPVPSCRLLARKPQTVRAADSPAPLADGAGGTALPDQGKGGRTRRGRGCSCRVELQGSQKPAGPVMVCPPAGPAGLKVWLFQVPRPTSHG